MVHNIAGGGLDGGQRLGDERFAQAQFEERDFHVEGEAVEVAALDAKPGVRFAEVAAFILFGTAEGLADEGKLVGFEAVAIDAVKEGRQRGVLEDLAVEQLDRGTEEGVAAGLFIEAGCGHGSLRIRGRAAVGQPDQRAGDQRAGHVGLSASTAQLVAAAEMN